MYADKLRVTDDNGLVPAGQYFKRLAVALREANEREARVSRLHEREYRVSDGVREAVQ